MPNKCTQCGMDLMLRPAGIAKASGKPYDAFWACSSGERHVQAKANISNPAPKNSVGDAIFQTEVLDYLQRIWDKLNNELPD